MQAIKSQTNKRQRKERTVKMVNQKAALLEAIIVRLEEQAAIEARQSVERDSRVVSLVTGVAGVAGICGVAADT